MTQDLVHGGALDRMRASFPEAPEPWIDLSTGINPWAYPVGEIPATAYRHLPTQAAYDQCRDNMAAYFGAPGDAILPAPGSELLIRLLPSVIPARRVAILTPTYGDHAEAWRSAGADVTATSTPLEWADKADAVVICNPNNPDGRRFSPDQLMTVAERLAARGAWLVVDEAYADLEPALSLASHGGMKGLIILRSFGKFFGLAGLRLGALIAPEVVRARTQARLGVWPVSGPALHVGVGAYGDRDWQERTRRHLADARQRLDAILARARLEIAGGTDLFRLVDTEDATALWETLAHQGIYVRRFGWSQRLVRIGLPADETAETRLAGALIP